MKLQSRHIIHIGINFVTIPAPIVSRQSSLVFQQAILSNGLDFARVENSDDKIALIRESPSPLEILVTSLQSRAGQVLVIGRRGPVSFFAQEAEAVIKAFGEVWGADRQVISSDGTIRQLYETTSQHAFQELWETLLNQSSELLRAFEKPVRGGGLRFVLDALPQEDNPVQIEVKIESFLQDVTKIFVETQFTWPKPGTPGAAIGVTERLEEIDSYIEKQVSSFLSGGTK